MQGSARSTAGGFAFHRREDTLDQGPAAIQFSREVFPHLTAHAGGAARGEALGGHNAAGPERLAAKAVIAFGVKLGVGQHTADGRVCVGLPHQSGQCGAVVPGGLPGAASTSR